MGVLVLFHFASGSGGSSHFLAECGDIATRLDDALTAIVVLVELVAEVLED